MQLSEELKARIKREIGELYAEGASILASEAETKGVEVAGRSKPKASSKSVSSLPVEATYQNWYSKALKVVEQVLPDRLDEFVQQYKVEKRKEIDFVTYAISDYLLGLRVTRGYAREEVVNPLSAFISKFQHQLFILNSANDRIDTILADIEGVLQAELFDSELSTAEELLKKKHLRSAGALAGVALEAHLSKVASHRGIRLRKKAPTISDFNQALKDRGALDTPTWRLIQRLADIRNL